MERIAIIGSGVAGTVVAERLLSKDREAEIVILEAGPSFEMGDYRKWLDFVMSKKRPQGPFADETEEGNDLFKIQGSRLIVKGGSTNHWGGWALRFMPEDFQLNSLSGHGADWPIGYGDLIDYYSEAETLLGVAGDSSDNVPDRKAANYPHGPVPYSLKDKPIAEALDRLNIRYSHLPITRNGNCITTGTCRYCPVHGRYSAEYHLRSLLTKYAGTGRISLHTSSPVLEISMKDKRRAKGVRYLDLKENKEKSIETDKVIVCAGTIESAKLLLQSTSLWWKHGLGNNGGHVGRHLIAHPLVRVQGHIIGNPDGVEQEIDFPTLACRHFDSEKEQKMGKMFFVRDGRYNRTEIEDFILKNAPREKVESSIKDTLRLEMRGFVEQFEAPENAVLLGNGVNKKTGLPNTIIKYGKNAVTENAKKRHANNLTMVLEEAGCNRGSIVDKSYKDDRGDHAVATCRMSGSDIGGVVDRNLTVHGVDNIYVCSNAVFPSIAAVNPTLTLAALSLRLGDHIAS